MFMYIPVYCLYIHGVVYKYLGMTPSGTTVVLLLFFIFLVFPFVCSSHLCILSYLHVPYGAFFINKEFEYIVMRKMIFSSEKPQKIIKIKKHDVPDLYRSLHQILFTVPATW